MGSSWVWGRFGGNGVGRRAVSWRLDRALGRGCQHCSCVRDGSGDVGRTVCT